MYIRQKGHHQTHQSLVIKLYLILLFVSCSSSKQLNKSSYQIIEQELNRNMIGYDEQEKILLDFKLNDYLISFIKEKTDQNDMYVHTLKQELGLRTYEEIFNVNAIEFYEKQFKNNNLDLTKVRLPDKVIINSLYKKEEKHSDLERILNYSRIFIYLSKPIFSKNNKYCIIGFSNGVKNGMTGGINIYKNDKGKWFFYKYIDGWIS